MYNALSLMAQIMYTDGMFVPGLQFPLTQIIQKHIRIIIIKAPLLMACRKLENIVIPQILVTVSYTLIQP